MTTTHRSHEYRGAAYVVLRDGERQWIEVEKHGLSDVVTPRSLLRYPAESSLWRWLRSHGITRPTPSGPSGKASRDGQTQLAIWIATDVVAAAKRAAEARGVTLRDYVEGLMRGAPPPA